MMRAIETDSKMNIRLIEENLETDTRYTIAISFDVLIEILRGRTNNLVIEGFTETHESISATKEVTNVSDEDNSEDEE
jgi:hypothetical protein